jgi:hypothetical protein
MLRSVRLFRVSEALFRSEREGGPESKTCKIITEIRSINIALKFEGISDVRQSGRMEISRAVNCIRRLEF